MGRLRRALRAAFALAVVLVSYAGGARAEIKAYDASSGAGLPGDALFEQLSGSPPVVVVPAALEGFVRLDDDGGAVTLEALEIHFDRSVVLGPDVVGEIFGPGAFIFIDERETRKAGPANVAVGGTVPGTSPGGTVEWGIVSGWQTTGYRLCLSSPVEICLGSGFAGATTPIAPLPSTTYDLGTWSFDAQGDYAAVAPYVFRSANPVNGRQQLLLRGRFVGESLPALPVVGLGLLAAALAVAGGRGLRESRRRA